MAWSEGLVCGALNLPKCTKYNLGIDVSTGAEFIHGPFRLFHEDIRNDYKLMNKKREITKTFQLFELMFNETESILEDRLLEVLIGELELKKRTGEIGFADQVRNNLLPTMINGIPAGIDLLQIDITRCRDAGNAPYPTYFEWCGLPPINSFSDLKQYFSVENFKFLRKFYDDYRDIDLFTGILLEERPSSLLGPIATCIISEQFYRFRFGDRHFFTNENSPYPFTRRKIHLNLL